MASLQEILVYLTLAIALGYLVKKFILPKSAFQSKKSDKPCGQDDCGCH